MPPSFTIRSALAEDEEAVIGLWKACGLVVPHNDPSADFRLAHGKANSDILVYVEGGAFVGAVMVGHDGHRGWVYYVAAHPDYRRRGVGRRLMKQAEDWLREQGVRKIMLMVRDTNRSVVDFYEHIGYSIKPNVVMEKWLDK
jgi:ribosomal protein S18 acetylase RimI-like enzyme